MKWSLFERAIVSIPLNLESIEKSLIGSHRLTFVRRTASSAEKAAPKLLVLGTGWGSFGFLRELNKLEWNVNVVSPRDHMLFTPLLASTAVGTVESRSVMESVRSLSNILYYQAEAISVDTNNRTVLCRTAVRDLLEKSDENNNTNEFYITYDYLIIAVGAVPNSFDIPGVTSNAFFLKEAIDAYQLRNHIHDCFEAASYPGHSGARLEELLTFVIVGGGPTGVELAGELTDFLKDVERRKFYSLKGVASIHLLEASGHILNNFDRGLAEYSLKQLQKQNIHVRLSSAVSKVDKSAVFLANGTKIPCGTVVWSTGVGPRKFVRDLAFEKFGRDCRIRVDLHLRVPGYNGRIFVVGDCAGIPEYPLPAVAQVAEQQGRYVARYLTEISNNPEDRPYHPFVFASKGMLAYIGGYRGVASLVTTKSEQDTDYLNVSGIKAWLVWRTAYLSKLGSWKNRFSVAFDWLKTLIFGRDVTRL